jgi:Immune inhibitor A peptidase M6
LRKKRGTATGVLVAMVALLIPAATMTAATARPKIPRSNTIEEYQRVTSADVARILQSVKTRNRELAQTAGTGTRKKVFITLDFLTGAAYPKLFKLRGKSRHMEVWVAADSDDVSTGIKFPAGDCRNDDASRLRLSDKKINYFMRQFERNILPKESKWLSRAPRRNGSQSIPEAFFFPRELRQYGIKVDRQGHTDYWSGPGRRTITLIDNFRDENFYDMDNQNTLPRVIGFFAGSFAEIYDRNVMHIDSYNWKHLTGANPPHNPDPDDPCTNAPAAPFTYESTFAHEFQHLLEYYADPDSEFLWVDEGLAEYAMDLTNYSKPEATMDSIFWTEIQCFYGWAEQQTEYNPIPFVQAGPENSLTVWEDQTHPDELLCDYGMVFAFMEMLKDHYGKAFLKALHNQDADGLVGLQNVLDNRGIAVNAMDLIDRFAAMVAVDRAIDAGAMTHTGTNPATDYRSESLDAFLDWSNDDAYSTPGAPPNGSDYVRLRDGAGAFLTTDQINKIDFDGAELLAPDPVEWTVDADPPTAAKTDAALFSGSGPNFDRSIVQEVSVPQAGGNLTFDTYFDMEYQWDYGFVQVSTDNGQTWTSLSNNLTGIEPDPGADPRVVEQLPGLNGKSGASSPAEQLNPDFEASWVNTSFDLSPYAGQDILLGFRYITDALADNPGWWIDNVTVAGTQISDGSSLTGWQTISQVAPAPTNDFTLQIVAYDTAQTHVIVKEIPLDGNKAASLNNPEIAALFEGVSADVVAAVVTYHDPTELEPRYAPYVLEVNNVLQPGGS